MSKIYIGCSWEVQYYLHKVAPPVQLDSISTFFQMNVSHYGDTLKKLVLSFWCFIFKMLLNFSKCIFQKMIANELYIFETSEELFR